MRGGAAAGVAGPVVFTGAWIVSSLRQTGHPAADLQISGLAAPDARDPWIMIAGFLVLGGCSVAFGQTLHDALGGQGRAPGRAGPAPRLIQGAGILTIAAGLLRRDHLVLTAGSVSWHNHAHDVISAAIYVDLVLAQLMLAVRFGRDRQCRGQPGWPGTASWVRSESVSWVRWRPWLLASATATAAALAVFAADTSAAEAGILQRVAVTIPLAAITAIAARLLRNPGTAPLPPRAGGLARPAWWPCNRGSAARFPALACPDYAAPATRSSGRNARQTTAARRFRPCSGRSSGRSRSASRSFRRLVLGTRNSPSIILVGLTPRPGRPRRPGP